MYILETIYEIAKQQKVRFFFVTLKWQRSTCYVNWAILIGDPVDVTTLLLIGSVSDILLYRLSEHEIN